MKIIALLPVKNEAWVLRKCLSSLTFCDEIIAIDDNSSDSTSKILEEFKCKILHFNTHTDVGWSEYAIRSHLLEEARRRNATHMVAIDGDEMFSDAFKEEARGIFASLKSGEMLSLPWIDVVDSHTILNSTIDKVFAWSDDGVSSFNQGFIHIPRIPHTRHVKKLDLPYAVIHFQHINKVRHEYKKVWYMMSEFEKGTRSALRINTTYHSIPYNTISFDIKTLHQGHLPDAKDDSGFWQQEKVMEILKKKGSLFFEPLDIWYLDDLCQMFKRDNHRPPNPVRIPKIIKVINHYKNKIINAWRERHT